MVKVTGHRQHVAAVLKFMAPDVEAGRITCSATVTTFRTVDALVLIEQALGECYPHWRSNPLEHLHFVTRPGVRRPLELLLLQVRQRVCQQLGISANLS